MHTLFQKTLNNICKHIYFYRWHKFFQPDHHLLLIAKLDKGNDIPSNVIKTKLTTDDWKTYEHPINGIDALKLDVTEYSEKLEVGFAYDKLDKEKKTRMLYWGRNFKRIQTIL